MQRVISRCMHSNGMNSNEFYAQGDSYTPDCRRKPVRKLDYFINSRFHHQLDGSSNYKEDKCTSTYTKTILVLCQSNIL